MKTLLLLAALALCSCATFSTTQIDDRDKITETNGTIHEKTRITTRAAGATYWASKSSLAKWKAAQTEKSQGAEVGGLSQSSDAAESLKAVVDLIKLLRPTP